MPTVSMRQLLEAGVHFGHQTRRWNPKMKPYIFAERNGIHIIDLAQTVKRLDAALEFVTETVARGETVLFVGTKKQAQEPVMQEAIRAGQPYVTKRWLGGMMTTSSPFGSASACSTSSRPGSSPATSTASPRRRPRG